MTVAMDQSLLPPNATALEQALAVRGARLQDIALPVIDLWSPADSPMAALPWLAWALACDRWDAGWSDAVKRATVAGAIAGHRRRGTVRAVKDVLAGYDSLLSLVQWFAVYPNLTPHTFEVHLPVAGADGATGGARVSAATVQAIVTDILRVKPARARFELVMDLSATATLGEVAAAQVATFRRVQMSAIDTSGIDWDAMLTDENGEPLTDNADQMIDTGANA